MDGNVHELTVVVTDQPFANDEPDKPIGMNIAPGALATETSWPVKCTSP
jgi:hypothetical protein